MAIKPFIKVIHAEIKLRLVAFDFKQRKEGIFTCELSSETIGCIGLNRAVYRQANLFDINPVVGVRHQPLEKLVAGLAYEEYHPFIPPTIRTNIGYIMPEATYKEWTFIEDENWGESLNDMMAAIEEYGIPFMKEHQTLEIITETMQKKGMGHPNTPFVVPVAYLMLGDEEKALERLESFLDKSRERKIGIPEHDYLRFKEKFIAYIEDKPSTT